MPVRRWLGWNLLIFVPKLRKIVSQQVELHGVVHVYAHELARLIPQGLRKSLGVRNRLVKVHWRHVKAMSLPKPKDFGKLSTVQATSHDFRDKLREFKRIDISAAHFSCKFAQNFREDSKLHLHGVERYVSLAGSRKVGSNILLNLQSKELPPCPNVLAPQAFPRRKRRNTKLCSRGIVRFP